MTRPRAGGGTASAFARSGVSIRASAPDIVLIDVQRPGLDGIAVAELLAARDTPPCVVLISSVIPGYHRAGIERHAKLLRVADGPISIEFRGRCAYQSTFDYTSNHAT